MENNIFRRFSTKAFFVLMAIMAILVLYRPALKGDFVLDDNSEILDKTELQTGLIEAMVRSPFRAITAASYRFDYVVSNGLKPAQFHLTSLFLHILAVFSLGMFWRRAGLWAGLDEDYSWWVGALSGLIFAAHPLNVEAVAYAAARGAIIASIFVFWGLYFIFPALENGLNLRRYVAGFLLVFAGLFSNEAAAAGPVLAVGVYFLIVLRKTRSGGKSKKKAVEPKYNVREMMIFAAPYVCATVIWLIIRLFHKVEWGKSVTGIEFRRTWATPIWAIGEYTRMALFPYGMSIDHGTGPASYLRNGAGSFTIAVLLVLLCVLSVYYMLKGADRAKALSAFAALWWLVCLSAVVAAPLADVIADRRVYLGMGAVGVFPFMALYALSADWRWAKRALCCVGIAVLSFIFGTASYASVWKKPKLVWENAVLWSPMNARAWDWLGSALLRSENNPKAAEKALRMAILLAPNYSRPEVDLGVIAEMGGKLDEATSHFETALKKNPEDWFATVDLGVIFMKKGDYNSAITYFEKALAMKPADPVGWFNLGNAQKGAKRFGVALRSYREALRLNPAYTAARVNMAQALDESGDAAGALKEIAGAIERAPDFIPALQLGAKIADRAGNPELTVSYLRRYLQIKPDDARAWGSLAAVLGRMGRASEAQEAAAQAQRLGAGGASGPNP